MDTLINLKNNLIQNFYIIGLSPEDFFYENENDEFEFLNLFQNKEKINLKPTIISQFPPNNSNFNEVNEEVVINHCFPNGLNLIKSANKINPNFFYFELDNLLLNYYSLEEKNIHSKMYFTCLMIYESLDKYLSYKEEIILNMDKNMMIKNKDTDLSKNYDNLYIPKILCIASVLPCELEIKQLLNIIYKNYSEQNAPYKLEKLIEQIVIKIPIPLNHEQKIQVSFDSDKNNQKILFPIYPIYEENLKLYYTNSLLYIFNLISLEDVLKILKYILLEIPILFFCENKTNLTAIIGNFMSLISPFKYVHPLINILPRKLFGLITLEKKFIFGINDKYTPEFFKKNEIEVDKNIVIVHVDKKPAKIDIIYKENHEINGDILIIEENNLNSEKKILDYNNNYLDNDYVIYNGTKTDLINIELPNEAKKIISDDLIAYAKKNSGIKEIVNLPEYNYKIRYYFYNFFISLLNGYSDYFLNSKYFYEAFSSKACGFELLYKDNKEKQISQLNFIKEIFNFDEFVNKSDSPLFFFVFCQTKLFWNFLRERIYLNDKVNSMKFRQFDQICYLKKHKELRKIKENKGVYENYKKEEKYVNKQYKVIDIKIINDDFTDFEKEQIKNKDKKDILIKYAQKITLGNGKILKKYFIFPKLIFDDEFFSMKYENLFFMHGIELPSSKIIDNYKKICTSYSFEYYKQRRNIFHPASLEKLPSTNNSKGNF